MPEINIDHNWKQLLTTSLRESKALAQFLNHPSFSPRHLQTSYPIMIPLSLAEKIKSAGPSSALWKQFVPELSENKSEGFIDPIGDKIHQKTSSLIHRYKNRLLILPTTHCPVICRYCFRKNELYDQSFRFKMDDNLAYLKDHPEVNEVVFTGGDPMIADDTKWQEWLQALSLFPQVKYVRIHTRMLSIIPERFTAAFVAMMQTFKPHFKKITLVLHVNHASEWELKHFKTCEMLSQSGIFQLLSQSVLLKGVNDCTEDLCALFTMLADHHITPYYLHHPDRAKGTDHFQMDLSEGLHLYRQLQHQLPGWMIPKYIYDSSDGSGKKIIGTLL